MDTNEKTIVASLSDKKRWIIYALVGMLFGVLDFYWEKLPHESSAIQHFIFAWGFFLIPAVPAAICEFKISKSKFKAALADALIWTVAIITFYFYQLFELVFVGNPSRMGLHISNSDTPYWTSSLQSVYESEILEGIKEWILVAIISGFFVGFCVSFITLVIRNHNQVREKI